jgi:tetratricopeptide (TPR) repeat protein
MRQYAAAICLALGLSGGVSAIKDQYASNYEQTGAIAQARGDWDAARRAYAIAVNNVARSDPRTNAIYHYEYGRSLGVTCFFVEAERELNIAYDFDQRAGQALYLSLVELARLNLDQRKFPQAALYFERALSEIDRANVAKVSPMAYADTLDEYASALSGAGHQLEAAATIKRASEIRSNNPKGHSITDRTPYGRQCANP